MEQVDEIWAELMQQMHWNKSSRITFSHVLWILLLTFFSTELEKNMLGILICEDWCHFYASTDT